MADPKNPANNWAPDLDFAKKLFKLKTGVFYKFNGMEAAGVKIRSLHNSKKFNYFVGTAEEYEAKTGLSANPTKAMINEHIKDIEFRDKMKKWDRKTLFKT